MKKLHLVFFALSLLPLRGFAMPDRIVFRHLGIEEGFSQTSITALYQDENGAIWIAGNEGLFKYHGTLPKERIVLQDGSKTNEFLLVKSIKGDGNGLIYICEGRGIVQYSLEKETFIPIFTNRFLAGRSIGAMCMYEGIVYATVGGRMLCWSPEKGEYEGVALPDMDEVTGMICTPDGTFYMGTLSTGLFRLEKGKRPECVIPTRSKINALLCDQSGNIWATTRGEGVYRISKDGTLRQWIHDGNDPNSLTDNYVKCLCDDRNGLLWFGTMYGLDCFDPETEEFRHFGKSAESLYAMRNLTVECIIRDRRGTMWCGSYYTGITYFSPDGSQFGTIPIRNDDLSWTVVADIAIDNRNNVWAATSDKGLYYYTRSTGNSQFYNTTNRNISGNKIKKVVYEPKQNMLWLSSFMGGVSCFDIRNRRFEHLHIGDVAYFDEGTEIVHDIKLHGEWLYVASYAGVFRLHTTTRQVERLLNLQRVFNVLLDNNDNLYIVSQRNIFEAYRLSKNNAPELWFRQPFLNDVVNALYCDSQNRVWIATTRNGLLHFDTETKSFTRYDKGNCGMGGEVITSVAEIRDGLLAAGYEEGISIVDIDRWRSVNYDTHNGFPVISMLNGCIYNHRQSEEIFFGGMNGIAYIPVGDMFDFAPSPAICFSNVRVDGKTVRANDRTGVIEKAMPYASSLVLTHRQTMFDVEVGYDDYINFNPNDYQYMLEGYDETWHDLTPGNNIGYMNLPPGSYTLTVLRKHANATGDSDPISLHIRVYPPFYASIYAYILYVIAIIAITYTVVRYYDSKRRLEDALEIERKDKERNEFVTQWKLRFFTNISHEFRTPLTLIIGQLDLLMSDSGLAVRLRDTLTGIRRNATHLKMLIDELIDFRKQEQGFLKLRVVENDLIEQLEQVYISFHDYARLKGVSFKIEKPEGVVMLWFDPVQMQKVFYNLISNAFKHTSEGGSIVVRVVCETNGVKVSVADTGHGISPELFETIFERFYHNDEHSSETGVGIGLALTKEIVELHGGRIGVESTPGAGSVFTVELPFGKEHLCDREKVQIGVASERLELVNKTDGDEPPSPVHYDDVIVAEGTGEEKKYTILVVEDDVELREMLVRIFTPGYTVLQAADGEAGLETARKKQPDLIVSDVMMPRMSGTQMCARIKSDFELCHIPVVLLTALATPEQNIEGLKQGADDYVFKPFHVDVLLAKCESILHNRMLIHKKFHDAPSLSAESLATNPLDETFTRKLFSLIDQYLGNDCLDVSFLCRELAVSRTALFTKVKAVVGVTPNEMIHTARLKRAAWLLKYRPEMKLMDIIVQTGFNSIQYFGRSFKSHYGMTPSQWRNNTTNDQNITDNAEEKMSERRTYSDESSDES